MTVQGAHANGRKSDDTDDVDGLVRIGVIELVLGQCKLWTDHYRTATSQISAEETKRREIRSTDGGESRVF